ncbi:DUF4376 domain-containing protein [Brucella anthropi]|uniref:DUF4376 domain-containing protein n=1 Tax=Brucella anthropi TaxID=529 RepID=UPI001F1DFA34|nr:DUF4376 domain-containing protein [Brucella anthropi]
MITSAKYTEYGSILALLDGVEMTVPDDRGNRHRVMIAEWEADGNTIEPYSPPAPDLPAYAAQKRWEKENGGIIVGGAQIATDDRSKVMISGARVAAEKEPNFSTEWKAADGSFLTVNAAMVIAISDAMLAHVSNCFAIEAQVLTDIESGLITTPQEVDTAFA